MKPKEAVINMVSTLTDMDMNDCDDDTDDEAMQCTSAFMVTSRAYSSTQANRIPIDPPGLLDKSSEHVEPSGEFQDVLSMSGHILNMLIIHSTRIEFMLLQMGEQIHVS